MAGDEDKTDAAGGSDKKKSRLAKFFQEYHAPLSTLFLGLAGLINVVNPDVLSQARARP